MGSRRALSVAVVLLLAVAAAATMTSVSATTTPSKEPPPGTDAGEAMDSGPSPASTSPIGRRMSAVLGALPPPPDTYDYSKSTEANYAIARVVTGPGTSYTCSGGVKGTLQGEQYELEKSTDSNDGMAPIARAAEAAGTGDGNSQSPPRRRGSHVWRWLLDQLAPAAPSSSSSSLAVDAEGSTTAPPPPAQLSPSSVTPECVFVGKYARQRRLMDYEYHALYQPQRQLLHDKLIDAFLNATVVQDSNDETKTCMAPASQSNWLVFTAGCMGAGKGHTLQHLQREGLFPLNAFVRVDPDVLRELLPETPEYIRRDRHTAGYLTQKEVGYICEVLTIAGLENGQNVLVDGSMRNASWYLNYISDLRHQFPYLKVAILYVTAKKATIMERARRRAEVTGRVVPEAVILQTMRDLPRSVRTLSPAVDFVATFANENEPGVPVLLHSIRRNSSLSLMALLEASAANEKEPVIDGPAPGTGVDTPTAASSSSATNGDGYYVGGDGDSAPADDSAPAPVSPEHGGAALRSPQDAFYAMDGLGPAAHTPKKSRDQDLCLLSAAKATLSRETSGGSHGDRPPDAAPATDGDRKAPLQRRTSARASREIDAMVHDTVLAAEVVEPPAEATAPTEARQSVGVGVGVDVNSDAGAEVGFTPVAPEGYGLFSGHGVYGVYGGGGGGGGGLGRGGAYSEAARQQAWREEFKNVWKMSC